jgi:hypothetical protein
MIEDDDDRPLLLSGGDQPPAPKPSSPGGVTLTVNIAPEHAEAAHHALSVAADKVGPMIGELLGLAKPAAKKPKPTGSSPEAQALVAGLLGGLGQKYEDPGLTKSAQFLARTSHGIDPAQARQGIFTAAVATRPPAKPSRTRKPRAARNKSKGRGKR